MPTPWPGALAGAALALLAGCAPGSLFGPPLILDTSAVRAFPRDNGLNPQWHQGAFMEIFVRAYQDSNGDGVGDIRGLIGRLDELQDLGVRGIWLMPITRSEDRDHGYATTDYRAVEPDYGTLQDMQELLRQAHRRGIGVIMDYVINHASHEFPPFREARSDPRSPWREWFVWSQEAPKGWDIWGKNPWYHVGSKPWTFRGEWKDLPAPPPGARDHYFGTFGAHMPDFNLRHAPALEYHFDSLRFWLNMGLDGVRLDAVPHMIENDAVRWNDQPESRALTRRLQDLVKSYPKRYTVCEATASPEDYGRADVCGGAFAFALTPHLIRAAQGQVESVAELARYWADAPAGMATFLSNHDIFAGARPWDQFGGDEVRYKLAAATYLLMPGTPFIYYGEEVGMAGLPPGPGISGDVPIRGPMSWDASPGAGFSRGQAFRSPAPNARTHNVAVQRSDPRSIRSLYRQVLALRNAQDSLTSGAWRHGFSQGPVLGFQRETEGQRTLVLVNYGLQAQTVSLPDVGDEGAARLLWRTAAGMEPVAAGSLRLDRGAHEMPPQSVQVWRLSPGGRSDRGRSRP